MSYGWFRRVRHQPVERRVLAVDGIRRVPPRRIVDVVRRHVREQLADETQARAIVRHGEMRDAARRVVRHRAAELVLGHLLVRDGLDDVGTGHEHVARVLDHDVEVGDRGE
jgi:hypothetical protein